MSAPILGAGGLVLGSLVASAIRGQAVEDREAALSGSQFSPVVAEALLRVFERDPAEFGAQPRHATV